MLAELQVDCIDCCRKELNRALLHINKLATQGGTFAEVRLW